MFCVYYVKYIALMYLLISLHSKKIVSYLEANSKECLFWERNIVGKTNAIAIAELLRTVSEKERAGHLSNKKISHNDVCSLVNPVVHALKTTPGKKLPEKQYVCNICGRRYKTKGNLTSHVRFECQKEPMFRCRICLRYFKVKSSYKRHLIFKHNIGTIQDIHFIILDQLEDDKPYKCPCGKSYKQKSHLKRHTLYECRKENMFRCHVCNRSFPQKHSCLRHLFSIHNINVAASDLSAVQNVSIVHLGDTDFLSATLFLLKKIPSPDALVLDEDKPFECCCGRRYKRNAYLQSHLRFECKKEPMFRCHICSRPFHQKSSFKRHLLSLHNLEVPRSEITAIVENQESRRSEYI
nr:unnamed protein product [Callosobruchus chinensis]